MQFSLSLIRIRMKGGTLIFMQSTSARGGAINENGETTRNVTDGNL